jgi:hypothetical protein
MEILSWINKNLSEIQGTVLFSRYFDTTTVEERIGDFDLFNRQLGIDLVLRTDLSVRAIHLYSGLQEGVNQFMDELPFNLGFSLSREETRQHLGVPTVTGGGDYSILYGTTPPWDKYRYESFFLHIQFLPDTQRLDLVTIFSLTD